MARRRNTTPADRLQANTAPAQPSRQTRKKRGHQALAPPGGPKRSKRGQGASQSHTQASQDQPQLHENESTGSLSNDEEGDERRQTHEHTNRDDGGDNEAREDAQNEDVVESMTVENYMELTKGWSITRIRSELRRRRSLNRSVIPRVAFDEGRLIMREHERKIAALALAARVSEYTLKKSM